MNKHLRNKAFAIDTDVCDAPEPHGAVDAEWSGAAAQSADVESSNTDIPFCDNVWPQLAAWHADGQRVVLVTLINIDGTSPRRLGANMAVSETGAAVGYITGGCLEAAIALEAQDVLRAGVNRTVRYGVGSPYIDIRLPCDGGIDVHFDIGVSGATGQRVCALQSTRQPFFVTMDLASASHGIDVLAPDVAHTSASTLCGSQFMRLHLPQIRVCIGGHGATADALRALSHTQHWDAVGMSSARGAVMPDDFDPWTAVASVHHDHDAEIPLLESALISTAFYVGAIGSRATDAARRATLSDGGVTAEELVRLRSPVGLIARTKSPTEMALSITSEIADVALKSGRIA